MEYPQSESYAMKNNSAHFNDEVVNSTLLEIYDKFLNTSNNTTTHDTDQVVDSLSFKLGRGCLPEEESESNNISEVFCNQNWDGVHCWPKTIAGVIAEKACSSVLELSRPSYAKFLTGNATRVCQENGTWLVGNLHECVLSYEKYIQDKDEKRQLVSIVQHMLFIGSLLSIICLCTSLLIYYYFRSLRCDRVTITANLMLALVLRFILLLIITEPFVFKRSSSYRDTEWVCKGVITVYLFATVASVNWMLIEGIYLNTKLTTHVFNVEISRILLGYYICGWGAAAFLLCTYVVVMDSKEQTAKCWRGYAEMDEIWIVMGPIVGALVLNAVLLANIVRIILQNARRGSRIQTERMQILTAAKATLILFPVLGINNLLLLYNPGGVYEKYYVMLNTFFGSTQGIFVSIVYCFTRKEVHSAIRRSYIRYQTRRNFQSTRSQFSFSMLVLRRRQPANRENAVDVNP